MWRRPAYDASTSGRGFDGADLDRMQAVVLAMYAGHLDLALGERQQPLVLAVGGLGADGEINRPVAAEDRERHALARARRGARLVRGARRALRGVAVGVD